MSRHRRTSVRLSRAAAAATVAALLLAGCTGSDHHSSTSTVARTPVSSPAAAVARTGAAAVGSNQKVAVAATPITVAQRTDLTGAAGRTGTLYVGQPVELTTAAPVPAGGITLTRRYAVPVPAAMTATFAFWDTTLAGWHSVPSTLSTDRLTVTALVHHLSTWTDIVGSVTSAADSLKDAVATFGSEAADWGYYEVGKVFDTRVDAPTCTSRPSWVSSANFMDTARNNSLLFCAGHDPKHPDVLEVKARVNRGFAFTATLGASTQWQHNTTLDRAPVADAIATLRHLGDALSQALADLAPNGQVLVGAGKEFGVGFTADQVRTAGLSPAVLTFSPPTVARFVLSVVGGIAGDILSDAQSGFTAGAILLAGCVTDLREVKDSGAFIRATKTCLSGLDSAAAELLANYLSKKKHLSPIEAGKTAGKIFARVSVYLALIGPVFSSINFAAEQALPPAARTVTIIPTIDKVTAATLRTAQVPAYCEMPAQRLVNNNTTKGSPGGGGITLTGPLVGYADFVGAGYRQALTEYNCTAGGVGWPQILLLIGSGGKLLGFYDLSKHERQEHSNLDSLTVHGTSADISWKSYEGAGFYIVNHTATVQFSGGNLALVNQVDRYSPVDVANDIIGAHYLKNRSDLRDPNVVSNAQWNELAGAYSHDSLLFDNPDDACTESGSTAVCYGTWYDDSVAYDERTFTMTLTKTSSTEYGWRMSDLELS